MSILNDDQLGEEKRKRGRPKKVTLCLSNPKENINTASIRKRGRRKKPESSILPPPITITNGISDTNYLVMLDIKFSDLYTENQNTQKIPETSTQHSGLNRPNNADSSMSKSKQSSEMCDRLICDSLINSFARLINEKKRIYDNCSTLQKVHTQLITPENSPINFFSNYEQQQINTKVLPIFELNGNIWPHNSNYACWNCDCQFETPPIGIPERVSNNQFYCSGNFCSFPCAARFIIDTDNTINRFEKISFLNTLYQKVFNLGLDSYVQVANPKQTLFKYGGCLSYSQYHGEKAKDVALYKLPMVPLFYYLCHENINSTEISSEYHREIVREGKLFPHTTTIKASDL